MTLVETTLCMSRRTVALWVPMAKSPSRLAATTLAAPASASGAPISTTRRKAVRTAHSKPNIHGSGARPRRSSVTATKVVIMPAKRKIGTANTFVSTPCSCRTAAAAMSTKLPVTCATNNPNSASTVKLSMKPAVKLRSGGTIAGTRRRNGRKSSLMIRSRASRLEPVCQPLHRLVHLCRRTRVAETDEMSALERIEIDAGRRRHVRLRQHAPGEFEAVVAEARDVGIEIKGAVDRERFVEAGSGQALEQDAAILLVTVLYRLHLGAAVEGCLGGDLRQRWHRHREIALQAIERPHERLRRHHPADTPSGHTEIFGEGVDDDAVVREPRRGFRRKGVVEAVIDFVGDEPDALALGGGDERGQRLRRHHGAGGIGGAGDEHALERRPAMRRHQHLRRDRPARRLRGLDPHRLAAERAEDMAIGRIARQRHRDAIAGLEQREKCENECG